MEHNHNEDPFANVPRAEAWSLVVGQAGSIAVYVALAFLVLSGILYLISGKVPKAEKFATISFVLGSISIFVPFGCLLALFIKDQFQYEYVFSHDDSLTELKYKIAGVWTAQEGSFLLWACATSLFGLLTIGGSGIYRRTYGTVFALILGSLCGILAYESPFDLLKDVVQKGEVLMPPRGNGMTPSLQNYWVVIHPPTIFLGFGALTIFFAYAVAAMVHKNAKDWITYCRPWSLVTLAILGLGLSMGGLWAYETQGWGGFWAWDPVENVSLVPWLLMAALIHGIIVQNVRGRWAASNLIMGGLPFLSFVYGTFLTRSGLLDKVSVHSFASMDRNALGILRGFLIFLVVGFIALCVWRAKSVANETVKSIEPENGINRENSYRFGMMVLSMLGLVIAVGMSWPVIAALRGGQGARVEEWLYHQVVVWFFIPLMLLMGAAPFVSWREMGAKALFGRIANVLSLSIGLTGFTFIGLMDGPFGVRSHAESTVRNPMGGTWPLIPVLGLLMFLCWFVAVTGGWRAIELAKKWKMSVGGFVSHLGFAVLIGGLILSRGMEKKQQSFVQSGSPASALDYVVSFKKLEGKDLFDRDSKAVFEFKDPAGRTFDATPGLYYYEQGEELKTQVWPFVKSSPTHDVYVALFPPVTDVWEMPMTFKPKEKRTVDQITVEYLEPTSNGTTGVGAKFGAKMRITTRTGTFDVEPQMQVTEGGIQPLLTPVGTEFFAVLGRMDAATRAVDLKLMFQKPLYPLEVFYKPMTSLVWVGTGILTIGGLMSAFARRRRHSKAPAPLSPVEV